MLQLDEGCKLEAVQYDLPRVAGLLLCMLQ